MRYFADCVPSRAALLLTNSNTSAILLSTLLSRFCKRGTDRKKLTFSSILCRPVRIIICWNARRSKTQTRELGFRAEMHRLECLMYTRKYLHPPLMDAVRRQLYKMASSPKAFPAGSVPRTLSFTIISNSPSADTNKWLPGSFSLTINSPQSTSRLYIDSTSSRV